MYFSCSYIIVGPDDPLAKYWGPASQVSTALEPAAADDADITLMTTLEVDVSARTHGGPVAERPASV